jgi:ABC-type multidrug transport system fused ATPase/permease subunit
LDEALSAVDPESSRRIMDSVRRSRSGKTTFVIAHRLSAPSQTDKVIVVNNGTVEEASLTQAHAV